MPGVDTPVIVSVLPSTSLSFASNCERVITTGVSWLVFTVSLPATGASLTGVTAIDARPVAEPPTLFAIV